MSSLRRQLTVGLALGVGALILVSGVVVHALIRERLVADFDRVVRVQATALGSLLEYDEEGLEFDFAGEVMPEFEGGDDPRFFELWREDGTVLERSPTLGARDLAQQLGTVSDPEWFDLVLPDGRKGRAVGMRIPVAADDEVEPQEVPPQVGVVVACSREELDGTLATLAGILGGVGLTALVLALLLVHLAVRRGLRSVQRLGSQVDAIDAASLDSRLPAEGIPAELVPVCTRLNELLSRLESAFERERRMTGNIAHELRTPLAELRSAADLAVRWPDDPELRERAVKVAHDTAIRMGSTVATLTRLARLEAGQGALEPEDVELAALAEEIWQPLAEAAAQRAVTLQSPNGADVKVRADREALALLLANLLANAAAHADPGPVVFEVSAAGAEWSCALSNACASLEADDLAHLREPFWQKDPSRTDPSRVGLGLTLAGTLARALGLDLGFALSDGRFSARLRSNGP